MSTAATKPVLSVVSVLKKSQLITHKGNMAKKKGITPPSIWSRDPHGFMSLRSKSRGKRTIACDRCGARIDHIPKKCPECGEEIYDRMDPHIRERILAKMEVKNSPVGACFIILLVMFVLVLSALFAIPLFVCITIYLGIPLLLIICVIKYPQKKWLFWTAACASIFMIPLLVELIALVFVPLNELEEQSLEILHGALVLAGGPAGIPVTAALDKNFPYDKNWTFLAILVCVTVVQWLIIWLSGVYSMRKHVSGKHWFWFSLVFIFMSFCGIVHVRLLAAMHS